MKIVPVGLALSLFLAISFTLAAIVHRFAHTAMPMDMGMTGSETIMGQGMIGGHHGPTGFLIGLAVFYTLGWYTALVYVPLYSFFNRKSAR